LKVPLNSDQQPTYKAIIWTELLYIHANLYSAKIVENESEALSTLCYVYVYNYCGVWSDVS